MKDTTLKVAGIIFLVVSLAHLARLIFKVELIIGGFIMPLWFSVLGFIIPLLLSLWMFKSLK